MESSPLVGVLEWRRDGERRGKERQRKITDETKVTVTVVCIMTLIYFLFRHQVAVMYSLENVFQRGSISLVESRVGVG